MSKKARVVVSSLRLRSGPGINHPIIKNLPLGTTLTILEQADNWLEVRVGSEEGFVYKKYVQLLDSAFSPKFLIEQKHLQRIDLPPTKKLKSESKSSYQQRLIQRTWNKYGELLEGLSQMLKVDPAVAVAVLCVESSGKGFAGDGRMIIRFENHIFWRYWGKIHPSLFNTHFAFDPHKPWQGHKFRETLQAEWVKFHQKGQAGEWEVFEFARSKHQRFSMYSISMGMPQIMGFNHEGVGYKSVKDMFHSFSNSERNQIIGLFDFIGGRNSKMSEALRKKDFLAFAKLYNGLGKARIYADRIKTCYELLSPSGNGRKTLGVNHAVHTSPLGEDFSMIK